jgi:probable F420-dependent oxidoreductase
METDPPVVVRPFRFGVVASVPRSGGDWTDLARRTEDSGYDVLVLPDTLRYPLAPLPALAAAAAATRTLRLGTYVLANDLRHPVLVANDAATIDFLSDGRFELGLGAGRPTAEAETRMLGLPFDDPGVRVARLAEALPIVDALLRGQTVTTDGAYYRLTDASIAARPMQQPRPPILVAGIARSLLIVAARHADTIALSLPMTAPEAVLRERLEILREAAGDRFAHIELNLNLGAVGNRVPRQVAMRFGVDAEALRAAGAVTALVGSVDEMCEQALARRAAFGISYITVAAELADDLAPVVARLRGA